MSRSSRLTLSFLAAGALAGGGCATINATVDPWARQAGVTAGAPVILFGQPGRVQFYLEGQREPLKVVIVNNPTFKTALANAIRQSAAEARAGQSPTGTATYTQRMEYAPAIYLRQRQTHRIRLVRDDGATAVVVAKPHVGMKYLVVDWILVAPSFFTSIIIDWTTGKWQVFDPIDLDKVFPRATDRREETAPAAAPASEATAPSGDVMTPAPPAAPLTAAPAPR